MFLGGVQECIGEICKQSNGTDPGAEPSPAYFNILMHGEEEEILDGTQLAADWTFSGLQKFGQGMLDRLRGLKLKNKLLEKVKTPTMKKSVKKILISNIFR